MRVCERLHLSPLQWDELHPGQQARYLAYHRVRAAEEARERQVRL